MDPIQQERHDMVLNNTYESGVDDWYCPICGRRFLLQPPPNYKKIVLELGDEYAIHSASKGSARTGFTPLDADPNFSNLKENTEPIDEETIEPVDDESLAPWHEWMDKVDFESKWMEDY